MSYSRSVPNSFREALYGKDAPSPPLFRTNFSEWARPLYEAAEKKFPGLVEVRDPCGNTSGGSFWNVRNLTTAENKEVTKFTMDGLMFCHGVFLDVLKSPLLKEYLTKHGF